MRALLLERAGWRRRTSSRTVAKPLYQSPSTVRGGRRRIAARVSPGSSASNQTGDIEGALERLEAAFAAVADDEPDADVAEIAARLSTMLSSQAIASEHGAQ